MSRRKLPLFEAWVWRAVGAVFGVWLGLIFVVVATLSP